MKKYINELDLYCLCCEYMEDYNKDDETCFVNILDIQSFLEGLEEVFDYNHTLSCTIVEKGSMAFNINNLIEIANPEIDYLSFKNSLIKFFYEE